MQHLLDNVIQVHSQLDAGLVADLEEMLREESRRVIWESFELVGPEKVKRSLRTVNSVTYSLDPCSSWLVEVAQRLSCEQVIAVGNSFLSEEIVPLLLKELCFTPSSRSHCWTSPHWTIITQYLMSLLWKGNGEVNCQRTLEKEDYLILSNQNTEYPGMG